MSTSAPNHDGIVPIAPVQSVVAQPIFSRAKGVSSAVESDGTTDPTPGNNGSNTTSTTVNTAADLSITKSDSPDPVTAGNNLSYTITVTNGGP